MLSTPNETDTLAIIEREIAAWDMPRTRRDTTAADLFSEESLRRTFAPTPTETFQSNVRHVLGQIDRVARHFHDDDVSGWLIGVKPLLRVVIGWDANTPLGREAGSLGYARMHARWNEAWDREQERRRPISAP